MIEQLPSTAVPVQVQVLYCTCTQVLLYTVLYVLLYTCGTAPLVYCNYSKLSLTADSGIWIINVVHVQRSEPLYYVLLPVL